MATAPPRPAPVRSQFRWSAWAGSPASWRSRCALAWWTLRYGLRETLKLIPMVGTLAAGALNAAAAFAVTVGIGEAACVWLGYRGRGLTAPTAELRRAFAEGLAAGLRQAKNRASQRMGKPA